MNAAESSIARLPDVPIRQMVSPAESFLSPERIVPLTAVEFLADGNGFKNQSGARAINSNCGSEA